MLLDKERLKYIGIDYQLGVIDMAEEKKETFVSGVDTMGRIQVPPPLRELFEIRTGKGVKDDRLFRVTIEEAKK